MQWLREASILLFSVPFVRTDRWLEQPSWKCQRLITWYARSEDLSCSPLVATAVLSRHGLSTATVTISETLVRNRPCNLLRISVNLAILCWIIASFSYRLSVRTGSTVKDARKAEQSRVTLKATITVQIRQFFMDPELQNWCRLTYILWCKIFAWSIGKCIPFAYYFFEQRVN